MTQDQIYQNIAQRTGGDIYLGVVGPVRSGKSTFIKRFAELMLLPRIKNEARRARAHDELPQSAAGRTIMTTEPKFIPEKAVKLELSGGGSFKARLIDCVGYMVDGALGHEENEAPRLVKSPWFDHEVPFDLAAETGTRCVIREHATVGLVVTTDGSVADLPREAYLDAERRIIAELDGIGKPYIILLNCAEPDSDDAQRLAAEMADDLRPRVLPLNCTTMTVETLDKLLQTLLYEFPIREIAVQMPPGSRCSKAGTGCKARSTRPCWILLPRCTGWPTLQASAPSWGVNTSPPPPDRHGFGQRQCQHHRCHRPGYFL